MDNTNTWDSCIYRYLNALKAAGRAKGTIRLHRYYMLRLREIAPIPAHVRRERLELWLAQWEWEPETRRSAQGVAKGFFKWCENQQIIKHSPARGLIPVRVPDAVPRPAPESAVCTALAEAKPRERLMIIAAAYCGLRACEVATMHSSNWDGHLLRVRGKGGRIRVVPVLNKELANTLENCLGWVFPGRIDGHLSAAYVAKLLGKALPGDFTGHQLRHRFGTKAYQSTHDILAVGAVMGHVKTDTTKRYCALDVDSLNRVVAGAS